MKLIQVTFILAKDWIREPGRDPIRVFSTPGSHYILSVDLNNMGKLKENVF